MCAAGDPPQITFSFQPIKIRRTALMCTIIDRHILLFCSVGKPRPRHHMVSTLKIGPHHFWCAQNGRSELKHESTAHYWASHLTRAKIAHILHVPSIYTSCAAVKLCCLSRLMHDLLAYQQPCIVRMTRFLSLMLASPHHIFACSLFDRTI